MKRVKRALVPVLALALAAALAAPALAGVHYTSTTTTTGPTGEAGKMVVHGWVSGEKGKFQFNESNNPMAPSGTYILTRDGGRTLYLVNPEEKTFAEWDLNAMLGMVGNVLQGIGPLLKFEFSDPKVEKLLEEDGGTVAGLPTRHVRYRTSYTMKMRVLGMGRAADTVTVQDIWATDSLKDAALGVWLRSDPPRTGNEQFDKLVASEREKVSGFPLKTVTVTTSTQQKGKESVTRQIMEVTELKEQAVPDSTFEMPVGYEETQILPARPAS